MTQNEANEALEIVTILAETLPKSCECDGGYGDDGTGVRLCLPHRAEQLLDSMAPPAHTRQCHADPECVVDLDTERHSRELR